MEKPVYKIKENKGRFHFVFTVPGESAEGQSETYTSQQMCEKGLASVRAHCTDDNNYELLKARNEQFYFVLRAKNHEVIYTSVMHNDQGSRENSIVMLKQFGADAPVIYVDEAA